MDNKCKRRKIVKSEEVRLYLYAEKHKYDGQERLRVIGFPEKPLNEAYGDCASQFAW